MWAPPRSRPPRSPPSSWSAPTPSSVGVCVRVCVCVCVCPASLVLDMSISLSDSNVALCLKLNSHSVDVIEIIIVVVIVMLLQNVKGTRTRPSLSSTPARRTKEGRSSSATSGPSLKARSWLTKTTSSCTMITTVKTLIIIRINC